MIWVLLLVFTSAISSKHLPTFPSQSIDHKRYLKTRILQVNLEENFVFL